MAEFKKIEATDSLNDGRVKLNEAIDGANKAVDVSEDAISTSNTAKQIAQTAEAKSDRTQTQLDTIVIDGDSSVEAAQARLPVEGGAYATLKARLDDEHTRVTQQLTETALKTNEVNYYDILTRNSTDNGGHTLKVSGDRNLLANIKLTKDDSVDLELRKDNNDDFIKFRNVYLKKYGEQEIKQDYSNVIAGSMSGTTGNNHYTSVIGTKIEQKFTGSSISMAYYVDIFSFRSGLWKCYVDGKHVKDLSQHPNAVPSSDLVLNNLAITKIASGLSVGEHTLVIEYVGADPKNPVETPRGWIRVNDNSSGNPVSNQESFVWIGEGMATIPMIYDSNKEFAFSVDVNETNGNPQWFPEHNNLGTVFAGKQELYVDGVIQSISAPATYNFKEVKIIQRLYGRHPSFTGDVCEFTIISTITYLGINFETKVKWLKNAYIQNGYGNMFTLHPAFADTLVTSLGGQYNMKITDGSTSEVVEKIPYSFIAVSNKHNDFYAVMSSHSPKQTFRFGERGTGGNVDGTNYYYVQHRSATLQKLYPRTYQRHSVKAGDIFKFDGHFGFGFLPYVNSLVT